MYLKNTLILTALLLASCQNPGGSVVRYCNKSEYVNVVGRIFGLEYIDVDLGRGRLFASDTTDLIELVDGEGYFGMIAPIPLLVPKFDSSGPRGNIVRITHGQLLLDFRPDNVQAGEFRGDMHRVAAGGRTAHMLTYKYNRNDGIYEIIENERVRDLSYQNIFRRCGGATLFAQPQLR